MREVLEQANHGRIDARRIVRMQMSSRTLRLISLPLICISLALLDGCAGGAGGSGVAKPETKSDTKPVVQEGDKSDALQKGLAQLQAEDLGRANIPIAQTYLDQLLARIQAAGPQPATAAKVVIWPRLTYNAYSQPDGLIIVDLGWLKDVGSEAELTALLAHEYGHLVKGHMGGRNVVGTLVFAAQKVAASKSGKLNLGSELLSSATTSGWTNVLNPNWSRGQEFEADAFALETTRKMEISYPTGVKAFLERIQSVENASAATTPSPSSAESASSQVAQISTSDTHPTVSDRIAKVRALNEGAPRLKTKSQGKDPWRLIVESTSFKTAEAEYLVISPLLNAWRTDNKERRDIAERQFRKLPQPYRTATALALSTNYRGDVDKTTQTLRSAIAAPDATFKIYTVLARVQRDRQAQYSAAVDTVLEGLDRVQYGGAALPPALEFLRDTNEILDHLPEDKKTFAISTLALKISGYSFWLRSKCFAWPDLDEACTEAYMTEEMKRQQKEKDEQRQKQLEQKINTKMDSMFNSK